MTPQPAPLARRVLALVVDALIVGVVLGAVSGIGAAMLLQGDALGAVVSGAAGLLALIWLFVYTGMQAGAGSIGMRVTGVRLVSASGFGPLGYGRALLRNLVFGAAGAIIVGYFSVLMDGSGRQQGWHDRAADALMVDARTMAREPAVGRRAAVQPVWEPLSPPPPPVFAAPAPQPFGVPSVQVPPRPAALAPEARPVIPTVTASPAQPPVPPPPARTTPPPPAPVYAPAAVRTPGVVPPPGIIAHVPGITIDPPTRPEPAAVAPSSPPVVQASHAPSPQAVAVLIWDDGTTHVVDRVSLFGRDPLSEPGSVAVRVQDATMSLSKTHFQIGRAPDGAVSVIDRASTNGVVIARDSVRTTLRAGEPTALRAGDLVECGDRWARVEAVG